MSDERDETRSFSPFDDATWADDEDGPGRGRPGDRVRRSSRTPGERSRPQPAEPSDATRVQPAEPSDATRVQPAASPDATRVRPDAGDVTRLDPPGSTGSQSSTAADGSPRQVGGSADDATRIQPAAVDDPTGRPPRVEASTVVDGPTGRRLDATSVMPAAGANPAWSGRAEVRPPQPGRSVYQQEVEWPAGPDAEPRDRWWMPIVVGAVVLVLLAALGWGIYRIFQNAGRTGDTPGPAVTTSAPPVASTVATTPTTRPSSAPATTEPTDDAAAIPALRGLTVAEAKSALRDVGIDSTRVIYRSSAAQPNTVIDSDPPEGQEVPADTTVTLVVAAPPTASPSLTATGG